MTGERSGPDPDRHPPPPPDDDTLRRHVEIDEAIQDSRWRDRRRADLRLSVLEGAVLLALVTLLVAGLRPVALGMAALLGGPAAGAMIHVTHAGRTVSAAWGTLAFAVFVAPATFHHAAVGILLGCPLTAIAFAAYGIRRESRAHPGWE